MDLLFFPLLRVNQHKLQGLLAGKTVLITGASYGIGECLALHLAFPATRLILVARTEEKLWAVQAQVEARGGQADVFPCDLRQPAEVEAFLEQLYQLPKGIDILVNNAGKSIRRSLFDSLDRFHDFTRTMNLNYFGPVQMMLALTPTLVAQRGHIINISAINVLLLPAPQWAAYQASKTAFDQWFRCAAPELNAQGVKTTSIYLPLVRTRMIAPTKAYQNMPALSPDQVAKLICKAMISRPRTLAPWWLILGQLASVLLRWPGEVIWSGVMRRRR